MPRSLRLGTDLIPQAGVAVGLAVLGAERVPGPGNDMATIVLGSVILFELVRPLLVARGLVRERNDSTAATPDRLRTDLHDMPISQLLAAGRTAVGVPAWILDWCECAGADLLVLGPDTADGDRVRDLCDRAHSRSVALRWRPIQVESFAGAVVRTAAEVGADVVLLLVPSKEMRERSRLVLSTHERITRYLDCIVVLVPYPDDRRHDTGQVPTALRAERVG